MRNKNNSSAQWDQAENIWALLELAANKYGDKDAFIFKKVKEVIHKSFRDFHNEAHSLAAWFIKEGMRRKRIVILGENSYEWILSWYAIILSDNIAVPMDRLLHKEQMSFIINDTEASAIVCAGSYADMIPSELSDGTKISIIDMESDLRDCISQGADILKSKNEFSVPDFTDKNEMALIIYTSGTTGIAKGVTLTQDNFCFDMNNLTKIVEFTDINLFVLPLNHVYASTGLMLFILKGNTTCISTSLKRVSQEMKEYKPGSVLMVPLFLETMYAKIIDSAKNEGMEKKLKTLMKASLMLYKMGIDVRRKLFKKVLDGFGGNLKTIICGGAPLDPEYVRAFRAFGIDVFNGYGITECSPCVTGNQINRQRDGSVGPMIPGAEIKTNTPDGKSEGEIYIRGRMVMRGYYKNEEATKEAFDGDWYKSGDIGYIDNDGFIFITGRKKNIIILSNGKNLYPEELELQIIKIPAVREVIVYEDGRMVAAEIFADEDWITENGITDTQKHIELEIDIFNKLLPPFKHIAKVKIRDVEFPKTSSQKIKRY